MKNRFPIVLLVFLLAVPTGCQKQGGGTEKGPDVAADVAALKALNEEFVRLYNAEDFDRLMAVFYAHEAILMPSGAPTQIGKEAILRWFQEDSKKNVQHIDSSDVESVRVSGDLAVARGTDTGTTTPRNGGEAAPYSLKWLIVFERQPDRTWKCIEEISNDNPPASVPDKGKQVGAAIQTLQTTRNTEPHASSSKPAAELDKLAIYIGRWKYEGEYSAAFAGTATKITGDASGEMILGGHFLEWRYVERGPAGESHGFEFLGYDPINKNYPSRVFGDDGSILTSTYVIDKNVSHVSGKMIAGGKEQLLKVTETFAPDGMSFKQRAELSVDGRSWAPIFEATFTKQGPAAEKLP